MLRPEEWNGEVPDAEAQDEEAQDSEARNQEAPDEEAPDAEAPDEEAPHTSIQDEENEDEEPPYPASPGNEDSISLPSNPYPEDDFLLPLTRQPARTTPPPPFPSPPNLIIHPNSSPGLSIPSPGLSIPSNPYPEDAPSSPTSSSQPPPPPPPPRPTQSPSPYYRAVTPPTPHARFPIYPVDRTISPISPFNASRHLISAEGTASSLSYRIDHRQEGNGGYNNDGYGVEGGYTYAPNHPYHGMSAQETSEYWLGLEGYHTESERNLRRRGEGRGRRRTVSSPVQYDVERVFGSVGESYEGGGVDGDREREDEVRRRYLDALTGEERRMAEQEEDEEFAMRTSSGETNAGRKNMMNRLLSTFACRPGTVTPLHTTTTPNPTNTNTPTTPAVPTTPKKYTIAYLSHKIHRTQKHEEEARLRERLMALRLAEPSAPQTHHIEDININNPTEIPVLVPKPKAKRRKDSTQPNPNPPSLVPNLESRTQSVIGPPVGLSQMIQRAPGSVRVMTPLPVSVAVSDTGSSGGERGEEVQRGPRQEHSGSSLSDRLRQTQLEDLPLQQDAAKEIRDLMMALERDQGEVASTPVRYTGGHGPPNGVDTSTTPIERVDELPAGFSRPETTPSSGHTQPSLSAHETLERHFRTQRQVNERFIRPVRAITSQSSSRTLPRSYRVPEGHGGGRGVLRVTNVVVQGEELEGSNEVGVGVDGGEDGKGGGSANNVVENQQDDTEELAADGEEQKGESLLRYNGDEEGGRDVTETG
ncbi:uncharacterized protein J4E84_009680 [Alternaria hordeiaustralica]|uniref:uncharacterized protein n=1 Tax=Alternaria hordeiaustralica TaxID=1187925 RepID=UPI0020C3D145|nr:uncharacterized protein J4E84_009680 [Alternaria hordeiaustralica]KAI4676064.1 hypothetical protein J4E84_009680 [Alternaria hordeiaustralica]